MKRTLYIALISMLLAGSALAQQRNGGNGPAQPQNGGDGTCQCQCPDPGQCLIEKLGLDEGQAAEFEFIMEEARIRNEANHEAARAEHCAIKADVENQMAVVLTAEQFEYFLQMREERQSRRDHRGDRGRRAGPDYECPVDPAMPESAP